MIILSDTSVVELCIDSLTSNGKIAIVNIHVVSTRPGMSMHSLIARLLNEVHYLVRSELGRE